jgi:hypothetical protein
MNEAENERMRTASGNIETNTRLVAFLYLLARDEMPTGLIESCIDNAIDQPPPYRFTNGWLAEWAADAAGRLEGIIKSGGHAR